jgi:hypothetical protein
MKPLARRTASVATAAALVAGSLPAAAFADEPAAAAAAAAASAPAAGPSPSAGVPVAQALAQLKAWGVYKDDADVMKTYLADSNGLTPIGRALYDALAPRDNPADAAAALQPTFDALRAKGPYNQSSAQNSSKLVQTVTGQIGDIINATGGPAGSDEDNARRGSLMQAALSGAAVVDPPKAGTMRQVQTLDGYNFYDDKGLAYQINNNNVTVYNRDLQKNQHTMNLHPQPGAPFVPETGRYNPQTFDYSYVSIKNNYDALFDGLRRDRMVALAELLGRSGQYRDDMWFTDKTLEADLIRDAKKKTYTSNGRTYSVYDIVEADFTQREAELKAARAAVDGYNNDMNSLIRSLKGNPVISDNGVKTLTMDEQTARVALTRVTLQTQIYYLKAQKERLDPASPDSKQLMDALDQLDLPAAEAHNYKKAGRDMLTRLDQIQQELDRVRSLLDKLDPAASLDAANSILTATQSQLGDVSTDYSVYVEAVSAASLAKQQVNLGLVDKGVGAVAHLFGGQGPGMNWAYALYGKVDRGYGASMNAIVAARPQYDKIIAQIAAGDMPDARKSVIAMNPNATSQHFSAALFGDQPAHVTDDVKIAASLKANRDQIVSVFEKNKWIDTASSLIEWSVAIGLGGGILQNGLKGLADNLAPATVFTVGEDAGALSQAGAWTVRRTSMLIQQASLHTAARLKTLQSDTSLEMTGKIENGAVRYLAESGVRSMNAFARQATFTGMSAAISGGFTLGQHLISPTHSVYTNDVSGAVDAFSAGAKGGAWWANESWHPALNYVGIPASAFSGTRLSAAMDVLGARGAVDSAWSGLGGLASWVMPTAVKLAGEDSALGSFMTQSAGALWPAAAEGAASKGLVDRLAETGVLGKAAAIPLSMADNVAKYALISEGASLAGNWIAYNAPSVSVPGLGQVTWGSEAAGPGVSENDALERRIKGANQTGQELMQAPLWLALPTYSAHAALESRSMMGAAEGMRQYDAAGLTHEYANAEPGTELPFKTTPKTPISQRVFDFHFFRDPPSGKWTVTEAVRNQGIQKEMVKAVGGENAKPADVNPLVFQRVTKMKDGDTFVQLRVNDEVRLAAHQNFIRSLIADPVRAERILKARPGEVIPGVGRVTPEVQKDVAVALYSSEIQIGRPMPRSLAPSVEKILKPYLEANLLTREPAMKFAEMLRKFKLRDEFAGDKGTLSQIRDEIADWRENKSGSMSYKDLLVELRARVETWKADGKINESEAQVLRSLYDYVDALDKRFNSFNTIEKAYALADESLQALIEEFGGSPAPLSLLKSYQSRLDNWRRGAKRPEDPVVGKGADGQFAKLITEFRSDLDSRPTTTEPERAALRGKPNLTNLERVKLQDGVTASERQALAQAINDMEASPWAVHDAKGTAIKGWHPGQPQQFEALMGALTAFIGRRPTGSVRVFQMLKTGGGKTLVAFEGLLPLVEADAELSGKKVAFLTVQSNLEAQARMDFIAYKKIGSKLTFETYESLKTKAAEGKMKGRNALRDYWILGDEMDGAAQQPALTIGQVSGRVSRLSGYYSRLEAIDLSVGDQIEGAASARGTRVQTEARRGQFAVSKLDGPNAEAIRAEFSALDEASGRLIEADGPLSRYQADDEVRASAARLQTLLQTSAGDADALASARQSVTNVRQMLDAPVDDAAFRNGVLKQLQPTLRREDNLLDSAGSEEGLARLTQGAQTRSAELAGRIDSLTSQAEAAEGSSAPGAADRAKALRDEIALLGREKAMTDGFRAVDAGQRLTGLQDRIADAESKPVDQRPSGYADWKAEAAGLRAGLPAEARAVADSRAASLGREYQIGRQARQVDDAIVAAKREGRPTRDLEAQRAGLESDFSTVRAESWRLRRSLSQGSTGGDLGGLLRRIEVLPKTGPESRERGRLLDRAQSEIRRRLSAAADEVVKVVREGGAGWEDRAVRLLDQRRSLIESFAADENPIYSVFRRMKEDAQTFAISGKLRSMNAADNAEAQLRFEKMIDGQNLSPWETVTLLWDALLGREIDIPVARLGLTRLRAAQLLQALFKEPSMPGLQAEGLFWNLMGSMLKPKGFGGRGSWVRLELKRQLDGFFEDPAGIRLDNRTNRINVVHNGQWFESMDNETRRYWELAYGTDLTLPYTHQSISTIKDLTTDKETNFISFSGTAGEKLREHFRKNDIMIVGQGSTAPGQVDVALTARPVDSYTRIGEALADLNSTRGQVVVPDLADAPHELRQAVVDRADGGLPRPVSLKLDDFRGAGHEADLAWLEKNGRSVGDDVVSVSSVKGAPENVRLSALDALTGSATLRLGDFAEQARGAAAGKNPNAEVYAKAFNQLLELRAATGDADGVVLRLKADGAVPADEVPAEIKPTIDAYLSDARFKNKDTAVVRISEVVGRTEQDTAAARQWLLDLRKTVRVNLDAIPEAARAALDEPLAKARAKGDKSAVVRVSQIQAGGKVTEAQADAARAWLRSQADAQESGLMVLSVSDTRALKMVRDYLMRVKGLKADEISMVFSDTEYLRNNVPEAQVAKQMNLDGLDNGRVRVLILDTRVGGRGLDLNFKGQRGSALPEAFRGYTDFQMLIVDPHKMSQVHLLQAEGRIDVGRVLPNADRTFSLVMDIASVANYRVFRDMIAQDPFFAQLRSDPSFTAFMKARGGAPDWAAYHDYVQLRAAQGGDEGRALADEYANAVKKALDTQQAQVEEGQLRSSSVINDGRATTNGLFPGFEGLR